RVTDTDGISEFSPTPGPDTHQFTTVRIEADGKDQSLWSYPLDRSNIGKRWLPKLNNVGYFTFIGTDTVAMFLVGQPHSLVLGHLPSGKQEKIVDNIGRCLKTDQQGNIVFVQKVNADHWILKSYSPKNKTMIEICHMPSGREDFDLMPNGSYITSDGPLIKIFNPSKEKEWISIADFSSLKIMNINRLSIFRDRILFVNNK
ncbi:MAG: hypothetical protein WBO36_15005, partial [Saprospiraceae bacterium]